MSLRDSVRGVAISVSPIDVKEMDESRFSKTSLDMTTCPPRPLPGLFMDETLNWLNLMSANSFTMIPQSNHIPNRRRDGTEFMARGKGAGGRDTDTLGD